MKKMLLFLSICFTVFIIYYDMTKGTLPTKSTVRTIEASSTPVSEIIPIPYKEIKIRAGDSLLSIIKKQEGTLPLSIESIISDFENLNGIKPEAMQIGNTYKIPFYNE
ncbi:hypothetical protein ACIQD3_01415 [Peribacillus loiseleuriae]|uniref:hypothetical protein n=1 Tax=Peribacillus loiseleuriae TaxID=1679170 RepID=UPI0038298DC4